MPRSIPLNSRAVGAIQMVLSGIAFGFLGIFGKAAYAAGLTPGRFLSLRFLIAGSLTLGGLTLVRRKAPELDRRQLMACVALGALGYAVFSSCYFFALQGLSASLTVLLLYTYPILVTLGGALWLNERITPAALLGLAFTSGGLALLLWGSIQVSDPKALAFGVAAAVFYSAYILSSKRWLADSSPIASIGAIQLSAGLCLLLLNWNGLDAIRSITPDGWWPIFGAAVVSSVLAMTLFLSGLTKLKGSEASILSTTEPVTAIVLAALLLGERLAPRQIAGGGLVLAALVLVSWPSRE